MAPITSEPNAKALSLRVTEVPEGLAPQCCRGREDMAKQALKFQDHALDHPASTS
jgi:hypothetical protein